MMASGRMEEEEENANKPVDLEALRRQLTEFSSA